jgi:hypothetical protein
MTEAADPLRQAVEKAVKRYGVARMARLVDMSPQTLRKYLEGGEIRDDIRGKLGEWLAPSPTGLSEGPGRFLGSGL